jgi:2-polyprenyl-6-methoxyphenol hydroxylase-like FAD-dependent oxidoreductase
MAEFDDSHFLSSKTIIISGAGIAGLSLAVALAQQFPIEDVRIRRPKIVIYERDSHEDRIGRQGYSLSLRTDSNPGGIQVLDLLGLYDRIRNVSVNAEDSEADRGRFNVWDQDFNPIITLGYPPNGPKKPIGMRIRRSALQRELADAAAEAGAEIHWSTAVVDARPTSSNTQVQVSLSGGKTVLGDILIAADGSSSKIRSLLRPDHGLNYTGVYLWGGNATFPSRDQIPKPVDRDWGTVIGGSGIGLFVSPIDDKSALWSMSRASPEPQPTLRHPIPKEQFDAMIEESTRLSSNFHPIIRELVLATDPSTAIQLNAMDRPPFSHTIATHGPVVWIGDSNHAVSPFAGNGANMALMDAWDLANCLKNAATLEDALKAYDEKAMPRAQGILKTSRWTIDIAHARGPKFWVYKYALRVLSLFTSVPV